jgi:flagellar biosynthesis component FlhA
MESYLFRIVARCKDLGATDFEDRCVGPNTADSASILPRVSSLKSSDKLSDIEHAELDAHAVTMEFGATLVPLIREGATKTESLTERMRSLQRELEQRFGFQLHATRTQSNLMLPPDEFRILVHGTIVKRGTISRR